VAKTSEIYFLTVWRSEIQNYDRWAEIMIETMLLLEALVLASESFWWLLTFLDCGPITPVSASVATWLPLLCVPSPLLLVPHRTLVIGFRAYQDDQK